MDFTLYTPKKLEYFHAYDPDYEYPEDFWDKVLISQEDKANGSPKLGDMIGRSPEDHDRMFLMSKDRFDIYFEH